MGVPDEASADRPRARPGTAGLFGPDSVLYFPATAASRLRGRRPGRDRDQDREVPAAPASAA